VEEVVFGAEERAVPEFVEVAVKSVGAGFGEVVHLGCAIAALINRVGVGVDSGLIDGIEAEDKVGGETDVEAQPGIVGVVSVEDVAI